MPGPPTTPDRMALRPIDTVGARNEFLFSAQWLAYALTYRRLALSLADADARLVADVDRCSFIVVSLHHLLSAGLAALQL